MSLLVNHQTPLPAANLSIPAGRWDDKAFSGDPTKKMLRKEGAQAHGRNRCTQTIRGTVEQLNADALGEKTGP